MQTINMYMRANDTVAVLVDEFNTPLRSAPSIVRGMQIELVLHLLDDNGEPMTVDNIVGWEFVLAHDFDTTTDPQILVNSGITMTDNVVRIPILDTNTENLVTFLGSAETKSIGAELVGFASGETTPCFVLQFSINIRNRRSSAGCGTVTELPDNYYTKAQTDTLVGAKLEFQFVAAAGDTPTAAEEATAHSTQNPDTDTHFRTRNTSVENAAWSDWTKLVQGSTGPQGTSMYHYIAWASSAAGANFSLLPASNLTYRAEFTTHTEIVNTPQITDGSTYFTRNAESDNGSNRAWTSGGNVTVYTVDEVPTVGSTIFSNAGATTVYGTVTQYIGTEPRLADFQNAGANFVRYGIYSASELTIADAGNYFAAGNVEDALQFLGELTTGIVADLDNLADALDNI